MGNNAKNSSKRLGDVAAMVRASKIIRPRQVVHAHDAVNTARQLLVDFCRTLEARAHGGAADGATSNGESPGKRSKRNADATPLPPLSPRLRQTLDGLLEGQAEKQIAFRLGVSRHTIHFYVKTLYRLFEVNSRGELLARFVRRPAP